MHVVSFFAFPSVNQYCSLRNNEFQFSFVQITFANNILDKLVPYCIVRSICHVFQRLRKNQDLTFNYKNVISGSIYEFTFPDNNPIKNYVLATFPCKPIHTSCCCCNLLFFCCQLRLLLKEDWPPLDPIILFLVFNYS